MKVDHKPAIKSELPNLESASRLVRELHNEADAIIARFHAIHAAGINPEPGPTQGLTARVLQYVHGMPERHKHFQEYASMMRRRLQLS
ncbi:MAG: hypothetical protein WA210_01885 [Burkholderiaceae bacterium]